MFQIRGPRTHKRFLLTINGLDWLHSNSKHAVFILVSLKAIVWKCHYLLWFRQVWKNLVNVCILQHAYTKSVYGNTKCSSWNLWYSNHFKHSLHKNVFQKVFNKLSNDIQVERLCTVASLAIDALLVCAIADMCCSIFAVLKGLRANKTRKIHIYFSPFFKWKALLLSQKKVIGITCSGISWSTFSKILLILLS